LLLLLHFIARVLQLASVETYVQSGYDWDSETVNVLARHTALKCWIAREIHWYRVFHGLGVHSVALLLTSARRLWLFPLVIHCVARFLDVIEDWSRVT